MHTASSDVDEEDRVAETSTTSSCNESQLVAGNESYSAAYETLQTLGKGAFGYVRLARRRADQQTVSVLLRIYCTYIHHIIQHTCTYIHMATMQRMRRCSRLAKVRLVMSDSQDSGLTNRQSLCLVFMYRQIHTPPTYMHVPVHTYTRLRCSVHGSQLSRNFKTVLKLF